jgi:hypothetical protein
MAGTLDGQKIVQKFFRPKINHAYRWNCLPLINACSIVSFRTMLEVRQNYVCYRSGMAKKMCSEDVPSSLNNDLGGISYVDFDTKLKHKSQFCFRDNWDILKFVPTHYFFFETHLAKQFFYHETLVCFRGVAKPSFSDGFITCFSIELVFTKIDWFKNMTH